MRTKLLTAGGLLAAVLAIGMASTANGRAGAETKVTIKPGGETYGYVKSEKKRCKAGRKVTVFIQKGGDQGGGDDIKVGSDDASKSGDRYRWSIGNPGLTGKKIYAHAGKIVGCKGDNSPTIIA